MCRFDVRSTIVMLACFILASPARADGDYAPSPIAFDLADLDAHVAPLGENEPVAIVTLPAAPTVDTPLPDRDARSFGAQFRTVRWEVAGLATYLTAINIGRVISDPAPFRFQDEGWFGKNTYNVGVDKMAHAFNTYVMTEFLQWRIKRKAGDVDGAELTAAVLASGLAVYGELYDAHKGDSGFSFQDIAMNSVGAAFSVLRNTVPGLREKLAFRLMVIPNSDIYTFAGTRHYAQQRYILALQLSGFRGMEDSPFRFVELHAGYYATGFTPAALRRGERPQQRPFIGIGINLRELFFKSPKSGAGRVARGALDYLQVPFTAIHQPLNGDVPLP